MSFCNISHKFPYNTFRKIVAITEFPAYLYYLHAINLAYFSHFRLYMHFSTGIG